MLSIALCGVPVFFQVRKVEIAFHEKCKDRERSILQKEADQLARRAVPEGWVPA